MNKFIQTLRNIWSIEELRSKILVTLLLILVYRFGAHVVLPGIDPNKLDLSGAKQGLLGLFDTFAGGSFSNASIFALGIMPYISASIFMQLMTILVPQMQKLQKEGDSGRKKINQWTRYLTAAVTALQAAAYVAYLKGVNRDALIDSYSPYFWLSTVVILSAGTLFVMWLGEKIQDKGLGNGTSIIIMVGILARLPQAFMGELVAKQTKGGGGLLLFLIETAFLIAIILGLRRLNPKAPGLLIAVVLAAIAASLLALPIETIGTRFGGIPGGLPSPSIPDITTPRMLALLPDALAIAFLAGIESLLSAVVADGMSGRRHRANAELVAQGVANMASAIFGGLCVSGTIARTATNIRAGAASPVSGMLHSVFLLGFMMLAAPMASYIPLAALAGVLAVVAWNMADTKAFALIFGERNGQTVILLATFLLTVLVDLMVGIGVGCALGVGLHLLSSRRAA